MNYAKKLATINYEDTSDTIEKVSHKKDRQQGEET